MPAPHTEGNFLEPVHDWQNALPLPDGKVVKLGERLVAKGRGAGTSDIIRATVISPEGSHQSVLVKAVSLDTNGITQDEQGLHFSDDVLSPDDTVAVF